MLMANVFLMGILCFYVFFRITHVSKTKDPALGLILVGVAVSRIGIGLVNQYMGPLPGAQIDAIMFAETARNMAATPTGLSDFLIEAGTFTAFHARSWGGVKYDDPALFTLRSLDGKPVGKSRKLKVFHAFGDSRLRIRGKEFDVPREADVSV